MNDDTKYIKTLTIQQAVNLGFKVYRFGIRRYLPVETPRDISSADVHDIISDQFDPDWEVPGDTQEGYFTQLIQDTRGLLGPQDNKYLVRAHYSHNDGIQDWQTWMVVQIG